VTFRRLDPERIVGTARVLERRIVERFPGSGLSRVSHELATVAEEAAALSAWLARPDRVLRGLVAASIVALLGLIGLAVAQVGGAGAPRGFWEWAQTVESVVNDLVFLAVALYFLLGLEGRRKRTRALEALHVLRSLSHIVDMHQLTKDPEALVAAGPPTASSPSRTMMTFELTRYLDYSSELLALVSKVAALYVQELKDPIVLEAASAVEDLAGGLSRTIWQKIVILDRMTASTPRQGVSVADQVPVQEP